jgi:hypothetical protein
MTEFDNTNTGVLFNAENRKTEKSPTRNGSINIKCPDCGKSHDFWLSGWDKVSKAGRDLISLALQLKDGTATRPVKAKEFEREVQKTFPGAKVKPLGLDDEVPF